MKMLSATLLAAQKKAAHDPAVKVTITDQRTGVNRLSWTLLYAGSEADTVHAAAIAGDGSLIRATIQGSGELWLQRVANPGPASDFSHWNNLQPAIGTVGDYALALCARGATVRCFFAQYAAPNWYIRYIESTDYGATWGSKISLASNPLQWLRLAADFDDTGTVQLLLISDGALPNIVSTMKWTSGGGWGVLTGWTHTGIYRWIYGFAVRFYEDFNIVFGAKKEYTLGLGGGLWQTVYGNGAHQAVDTWSSLEPIIAASGASALEFRFPQCDRVTENGKSLYRLYATEMFTGSTAYIRNYHAHGIPDTTFSDCLWHDLIPLSAPNQEYAPCLTHTAHYLWLATANYVWYAPANTTISSIDVSADVLSIVSHQEEFAGGATVTLRNDAGQYANFPYGGQQIAIAFGFKTAVGAEYPDIPEVYWLESWEYLSRGKEAQIVLHAVSAWGVLKGWRTRNQYAWPGTKTIHQLLQWLLARVGFDLTIISATTALDAVSPSFTVYPNETGDTAVKRLIAMVTEKILWRRSSACIKYPQESETACYDYGGEHPIFEGNYGSAAFAINHAQVFGNGVLEERMRWDEIENYDDRLAQVFDSNLTTAGEAGWRAMAELRQAWFLSSRGSIAVPLNTAQELFDNITITDPRWSTDGQKKRVLAIDNIFDAVSPSYSSHISLGAP